MDIGGRMSQVVWLTLITEWLREVDARRGEGVSKGTKRRKEDLPEVRT
jgi:hypothetical protein